MARIGLIAGYGSLPVIFSRLARDKGDVVICFGLKGVTDPQLEKDVNKMHWLAWGSLQKGLLLLATERIKKVAMLGKIKKDTLFKEDEALDDEAKKLLKRTGDKKDYAILTEVAGLLKKVGVEVMDSSEYLKDLISSKGVLTKRSPTENEWKDIDYGRLVASKAAGLDIGQAVVVKDRTIIALEAVEGTDAAILRAGGLVKGGFVVVKVARPNQDMRFDIPLVGLGTLRAIIDAGGSVLALEEKKTILIDKEELVKLADDKGISIVII